MKKWFNPLILAMVLVFGMMGAPSFAGKPGNGVFSRSISADPTTLNAVTSTDAYSNVIQSFVFSSLLSRNYETWEWESDLAEKWEVSKDGKVFTFKLRDGVKWHDGQPLTAEDIKYSFDVFFEGRFKAPHMVVYLENFKEVKVVDAKTVQFITKNLYFKNFDTAAGLAIIPKHFYGVGNPEDPKFNKELIGTGPYKLDSWSRGQRIVLTRNADYFGNELPLFKDQYNFQKIIFRIVPEEAVNLELLKKGDIDFMGMTAEQFVKQTSGDEWGKKVEAIKAENSSPDNFSYGYIGWNGKNPFFKDRDTRVAMSHLVNREFMIEKFRFGMSELAKGPFGNKSTASSPKVKAIEFSPKKALDLLKKSGWKMTDKGLVKTIDGKETLFEFTIMTPNPDFQKYLTIIKEDMKKVGITLNIKVVEWNSFIKLIDERKFDAFNMGWQVNDLEPDPKQIWHSDAIPTPGQNMVSYNNPELDKLIDQVRATMDAKKRLPLFHKIHELIARDQPYTFLFNSKFSLYGKTTRIQKPKDTLKYRIGTEYWKVKP